jgi:hypothetical protein
MFPLFLGWVILGELCGVCSSETFLLKVTTKAEGINDGFPRPSLQTCSKNNSFPETENKHIEVCKDEEYYRTTNVLDSIFSLYDSIKIR